MSPRLPFLVVVVLVVSGAVLASQGDEGPSDGAAAADGSRHIEPPGTTWFCAGGSATATPAEGFADHTVIVAAGPQPVAGVLTVVPGDHDVAVDVTSSSASTSTSTSVAPTTAPGRPVTQPFTLAAGEERRVRLGDLVTAPLAAAVVELDPQEPLELPPSTMGRSPDAPGPTVRHEILGPQGADSSPCVNRSASTWHFAWGATTRDASERLVLFNPFPNDVAVDAVFSTDRGIREPLRWQGLTVPARSVVSVDVGDDVTRRDHVAATLHVRGGRLVVDRIQSFDGRLGSAGLSVAAGVPEPATQWTFPDGRVDATQNERIVLYNPGEVVADTEVTVQLAAADPAAGEAAGPGAGEASGAGGSGADPAAGEGSGGAAGPGAGAGAPSAGGATGPGAGAGAPSAGGAAGSQPEPFGVVIRPGRYEVLDLGQQDRIPRGVAYTVTVRSRDGVPVVVERITGTPTDGPGAAAGTPPLRLDADTPAAGVP